MDHSEKKQEWQKARGAREQIPILQQKREQLEENIRVLKTQLENDPSETKKDLLSASKKKMQELDHFLDELEEYSEEKVRNLKQELINMILESNSEDEVRYREWENTRISAENMKKESQHIQKTLKQIQQMVEKALQTRKTVKKRGLLSYIFGRNPNVMITQAIQETRHLIEKELPHIEELASTTSGGDLLREEYAELIVFLSELNDYCQERWNFKRLDTLFKKAHESLKSFSEKFQNLETEKCTEAEEAENAIDSWIKKRGD